MKGEGMGGHYSSPYKRSRLFLSWIDTTESARSHRNLHDIGAISQRRWPLLLSSRPMREVRRFLFG